MDSAAFEALYAAHVREMLRFLTYRTGDRALAEDLLADTFERALRARRRFDDGQGSPASWLYVIALNTLRDHARRRASEGRTLDRLASGAPEFAPAPDEAVSDREQLHAALATLSAEERESVSLRYGADLTVRQIAKVLGVKQTTVEGRLHRGLRKLRATLEASEAPMRAEAQAG